MTGFPPYKNKNHALVRHNYDYKSHYYEIYSYEKNMTLKAETMQINYEI